MRPTRSVTGLVAAAALAAAVSGCGSDDHDNGPQASDGAVEEAVSAASAAVDQFVAEQPPLTVEPLTGATPSDITLGVLTCAFPVCLATSDPAVEAAESLGWTVEQTQIQPTPESYTSAWDKLLQNEPDAILFQGSFPRELIQDQLQQVSDLGIPTVVISPNAPTPEEAGSDTAVGGAPAFAKSGELMGDVIVDDAGGPANVAFVWDPNLGATLAPVQEALTRVVESANGSVDTIDISLENVGGSVPGQIVNYLQSHPDTEYLAFSLADFGAAVPQALQAAGLADKVKIVSRAPQPTNLQNIKDGLEFASVGEENAAAGYRAIDALVRKLMGEQPLDPNPEGWHQIFVQDNVDDTSTSPDPDGVPDAFLEAWGATGS